jgi:hypothetical protein
MMMTLKDATAERMAPPQLWRTTPGNLPSDKAWEVVQQHRQGYTLEPDEDYELHVLVLTAVQDALNEAHKTVATITEDAIAGERARICKILRETSVNATRELLIRGVEEGATSIWVEDKL